MLIGYMNELAKHLNIFEHKEISNFIGMKGNSVNC